MDEGRLNGDVARSRLVISRRRALSLGGTIGLTTLLAACGTAERATSSAPTSTTPEAVPMRPSASAAPAAAGDRVAAFDAAGTCMPSPVQTEGPYWFDVDSIRSDVREDRPGTPFELALRVQDVSACAVGGQALPISNAVVEIWHCDAGGEYSGFESDRNAGAIGTSDGAYSRGERESAPTDDGTYLRGAQVADRDGIVRFTTIFPGWYPGRTTHVHVKVHVNRESVLSTQVYVPDDMSEEIYAAAPYRDHTGRDTFNDNDGIFAEDAVLTVARQDGGYFGLTNLGIA